jgi:hypothetical protein
MSQIELLDFIPSVMSAIAAIAAAIAAVVALTVSRKANTLSEKSILAAHHHAAALELSNSIDNISKSTTDLSRISYDLWSDWSREIESKDDRSKGGQNPRPLRHVLTNGSKMLANHGALKGKWTRHVQHSMFSAVRDGMGSLNEAEYDALLKKADDTYSDFESTFGSPAANKKITESNAFRWVSYQLTKRVNPNSWREVWSAAWLGDGWLNRYRVEFSNARPILEQALSSLRREKNKIEHSVLPLSSNPALHEKYERVLAELEFLLEDCDLDSMEAYRDCKYDEDINHLVLYSMGMAYLTLKILDSISSGNAIPDDF